MNVLRIVMEILLKNFMVNVNVSYNIVNKGFVEFV